MDKNEIIDIFEQISNLKIPSNESNDIAETAKADSFGDTMHDVAVEIQKVMEENKLTQEDLCKLTNMSQSNISKILNGKVIPRLDTLAKIASATNTKLVVGFESIEEDGE
ncbi:MAG: helix-turn-helix transcriptional regulator [Lachnospiraceae bacterium]|nr:helix-turn-helix transcriptional regulator [Lachnospiraceae bacterium]